MEVKTDGEKKIQDVIVMNTEEDSDERKRTFKDKNEEAKDAKKRPLWMEKEDERRQRLLILKDNRERYKDSINDNDNFERNMTPLEKEIYKSIRNNKSVYEISKESTTIYYNIEGKLMTVKMEDIELVDKFRRKR